MRPVLSRDIPASPRVPMEMSVLKVTIPTGKLRANLWVSVRLCSEAEWTSGDIGRNPQIDVFLI